MVEILLLCGFIFFFNLYYRVNFGKDLNYLIYYKNYSIYILMKKMRMVLLIYVNWFFFIFKLKNIDIYVVSLFLF